MSICAIIPARGGSKGVPGKNIRLLGGHPLIAFSIAVAELSHKINRIVISTDSEEIAEISRFYGAEVPFLRPSELAQDRSTDLDFMLHAIDWFINNEGSSPEFFVHLRPTTPFREPNIVDEAINEMVNHPEATSLRSAHPAPESPFKWFKKDENGYFRGILDGMQNDTLNNPRQAFPDIFVPDGYVDVLKSSFITNSGLLHGNRMIGFISPVCTEVDTLYDLELIEFEIKKKGSILWNYLNEKHPKRGF